MSAYSITINEDGISESAKEAVRYRFNPSGRPAVNRVKLLAAALLQEMELLRDDKELGAGREAAVAITNLQTASMWGVLAATKGL